MIFLAIAAVVLFIVMTAFFIDMASTQKDEAQDTINYQMFLSDIHNGVVTRKADDADAGNTFIGTYPDEVINYITNPLIKVNTSSGSGINSYLEHSKLTGIRVYLAPDKYSTYNNMAYKILVHGNDRKQILGTNDAKAKNFEQKTGNFFKSKYDTPPSGFVIDGQASAIGADNVNFTATAIDSDQRVGVGGIR